MLGAQTLSPHVVSEACCQVDFVLSWGLAHCTSAGDEKGQAVQKEDCPASLSEQWCP